METVATVNRQEIQSNWRNSETLQSFIGKNLEQHVPGKTMEYWCFGKTPTDKVEVYTSKEGVINKIETYSGLNWSARGGHGRPFCSVS